MSREVTVRRRVRLLQLGMAAGAGASALTLGVSEAASATSCNTGYRYVLQNSTGYWQGLEGYVPIDDPTLYAGGAESHVTAWLGLVNFESSCHAGNNCWSQVGNGKGTVSDCETSNEAVYYEENDYYGYYCNFYYSGLPNGQDNFYTNFVSGIQDANHNYQVETYAGWTGSGTLNIGNSWFPPQYLSGIQVGAQTEIDTFETQECPYIPHYQYFGADSSGSTATKYQLFKSPDGSSWAPWTETPSTWEDSPYLGYQLASYESFKSWGS